MLSSEEPSWIVPLCQSLTSEKAKERAESLTRLKLVVSDKRQLRRLSTDDLNILVMAYFRMLVIEVKFTKELNSILENRLRLILRDANLMLSLCLPLIDFFSGIDEIMETILKLLENSKITSLTTDILVVLNKLLSCPSLRCSFSLDHLRKLLLFCRDRLLQMQRGIDTECARALLHLSETLYEINEITGMKTIMQISIGILGKDATQVVDSTCAQFLIKALKMAIYGLAPSHPIFCRQKFGLFIESLQSSILFRRKNIFDDIVEALLEAHQFLNHDKRLLGAIANFLSMEANFSRFKFEGIHPLDFKSTETIAKYTLALAKYLDLDLKSTISGKNQGPSLSSIVFFGKCQSHNHGDNSNTNSIKKGLEVVSRIISQAGAHDQLWILSALILLNEDITIPDTIFQFTQSLLSNARLSVMASSLFIKHQILVPNLIDKLVSIQIDLHHIKLLFNNFVLHYSSVFWSSNAVAEFSRILHFLYNSLIEEGKLVLLRLFWVIEGLTEIHSSIQTCPSLLLKVQQFWKDNTWPLLRELDDEQFIGFFISQCKSKTITAAKTRALFQIVSQIFSNLFQIGADLQPPIPWDLLIEMPKFCQFVLGLLKKLIFLDLNKGQHRFDELLYVLETHNVASSKDSALDFTSDNRPSKEEFLDIALTAYGILCSNCLDESLSLPYMGFFKFIINEIVHVDESTALKSLARLESFPNDKVNLLLKVLDKLHRCAPSQEFLRLFSNPQFLPLLPKWWEAFDTFYIPVASRKLLCSLGKLINRVPSFLTLEETCLELVQCLGEKVVPLEIPITDIDYVPAAIFRLCKSSKSLAKFLIQLNCLLVKLEPDHPPEQMYEILRELSMFSSPLHFQLAYDYIASTTTPSPLFKTLFNQNQQIVSPWAGPAFHGDLCYSLADILLKHQSAGEDSKAGVQIQQLRDSFGRVEFEEHLKSSFFDVIACILILGWVYKYPESAINTCLNQFCSTMKLEWDLIKVGTLSIFVALHLLKSAEYGLHFYVKMHEIIDTFLNEAVNNSSPLARCLCNLITNISLQSSFPDERHAWMAMAQGFERAQGSINFSGGPLLSPIEVELATSLSSTFATLNNPKVAILAFKKLASIVSNVFKSLGEVPKHLQYVFFDQKPFKSLLKIRLPSKQSDTRFDDLLGTTNNPDIIKAIRPWIIADALINGSTNIADDGDVEALCLALSYCNRQGVIVQIPSLDTGRLSGSALQRLFISESVLQANPNASQYEEIYQQLGEWDYVDYLQSFGPSIYSAALNHIELEAKGTSSILLKKLDWTLVDLPTSFDPNNSDDKLYARLRLCVDLGQCFDQAGTEKGLRRLAIAYANFNIDKSTEDKLIEAAKDGWTIVRREAPRQTLDIIEALDIVEEKSGNEAIQYISWLAKSTFLSKIHQRGCALKLLEKVQTIQDKSNEYSIRVLLRATRWNWHGLSMPAEEIQRRYLDALPRMEQINSPIRAKVHYTLAKFFDEQFERLKNSELIKSKRKSLEQLKKEAEAIKNFIKMEKSKDPASMQKALAIILEELCQESDSLQVLFSKHRELALKAVVNYLGSITYGDKYDLVVARVCSLWMLYFRYPQFNEAMDVFRKDGPIKKFLPLMYQLSARLDLKQEGKDMTFQHVLQDLVFDMFSKYPNHVIYHLLHLTAASKSSSSVGSKRKLVATNGGGLQERRSQAASELISRTIITCTEQSQLIDDTMRLWRAYSELAAIELPLDTAPRVQHPFERHWLIGNLRHLQCPIPTTIRAVESMNDPPTFTQITRGFKVVGGINLPKIIECVGSDGLVYRQLLKGKDDVRQDAVMEQVFHMVNRIMARETKTKELSLRTYRVIPLQPLTGLMEWIEDASPIGDYLVGAHERYHKNDISPKEARAIMKKEFENASSTPESKLETFRKLCSIFHPIFGRFFLENSMNIQEWYDCRRSFILSASVNSMVGYVMGLGDRHCQNIMIDRQTGELIHIDLNMIFEMGKTLRVPELVPFRLTRDIVHAMGHFGLEGSFTGNAVRIMSVLRERHGFVLMIMDVFRHDPLYRWTKTHPTIIHSEEWQAYFNAATTNSIENNFFDEGDDDFKSSENNGEILGGSNKEADRVLFRVKEKLLGIEEGTPLNAKGQVTYLVNMATDERLLSQMYPGWQPWM